MDTYKIVYDETDEKGEIYGISIVEDPANLFDFVALSKEEKVLLASEMPRLTFIKPAMVVLPAASVEVTLAKPVIVVLPAARVVMPLTA
jgi:hypothetical protein